MQRVRVFLRHGLGALLLGVAIPVAIGAQEPRVRGHGELEALLRDGAGIAVTMPDVGYVWHDADVAGTRSEGSIWVTHLKMIYYFVHWGPIETPEISEEYVRRRIPDLWPSESLHVTLTRAARVAGHRALYAEATPLEAFYRAQFLVWNCPETGRQFIVDMNYNVSYLTPRSELQAQIDATTNTLACHLGAPTSEVPGHVARYDSRRFNLGFAHPLRWYVFESPFGVQHPAYRGVRDESIGSILAWLKDRRVEIGFVWRAAESGGAADTGSMVGSAAKTRAAVRLMSAQPGIESFLPEASESVTISGREVTKVLGRVRRARPDSVPPGFIASGRAAVLVIDRAAEHRLLFVVVRIDDYMQDGVLMPVDRDIFDRWTTSIVSGLR